MNGEEVDAEVGRAFEVGEEVGEEVVWVGIAGVGVIRGAFAVAIVIVGVGVVRVLNGWVRWWDGLAVVEDDDFVDAEDGEGAGDLPGEGALEVVGLGTNGRY